MKVRLSSINWDNVFMGCVSTNDYWNAFLRIINKLVKILYQQKRCYKNNNPKRFPRSLLDLTKLERAAWHSWKNVGSQLTRTIYTRISSRVKRETRNFYKSLETRVINTQSVASFYSNVRSKLSPHIKGTQLIDNENIRLTKPSEVASLFNNYFSSVYTRDVDAIPDFNVRTNCIMPDIIFSVDDIVSAVGAMNSQGTSGVDGVSMLLVKNLIPNIAYPLSCIFHTSYTNGTIPDNWRLANVTPIFKGSGSRYRAEIYRPVSLTSVIGKIMKSLMRNKVYNYLNENHLLSSVQHDFRQGLSTVTQLLETITDFARTLNTGYNVDCILIP